MKTKYLVCSSIFLVSAAVVPAAAADMPVKARPAPYDWTGWYGGVTAGYSWGRFDHAMTALGPDWSGPLPAFLATYLSPDLKDGSLLGGLSLGVNAQRGRVVWGLEADVSWMGLKGAAQSTRANPNVMASFHDFSAETKVDWLATVRPRVGWLLNDQFLPYVTGGLAIGGVKSNAMMVMRTYGGIPSPPSVYAGSSSDTAVGWTIGGGVEYALSPQWTMKAEYLHVDLGKEGFRSTRPNFSDAWQDISVKTMLDIVRVGANYRF